MKHSSYDNYRLEKKVPMFHGINNSIVYERARRRPS